MEISGKLAFSGPEILAIDDSTLEEFFKEIPQLNVYRRSINEIRRLKDHILSPAEEKLLAAAGEISETPGNVFSMMNNADAAFPPVHTKDGEELPLTNGSSVSLLQNSDRDVRKEAFVKLLSYPRKTPEYFSRPSGFPGKPAEIFCRRS